MARIRKQWEVEIEKNEPIPNYYETLEITIDADQKTIKLQYRKLAKMYHSDSATANEDRFKLIKDAYEILSDVAERSRYDEALLNNNYVSDDDDEDTYSGEDNSQYEQYEEDSYTKEDEEEAIKLVVMEEAEKFNSIINELDNKISVLVSDVFFARSTKTIDSNITNSCKEAFEAMKIINDKIVELSSLVKDVNDNEVHDILNSLLSKNRNLIYLLRLFCKQPISEIKLIFRKSDIYFTILGNLTRELMLEYDSIGLDYYERDSKTIVGKNVTKIRMLNDAIHNLIDDLNRSELSEENITSYDYAKKIINSSDVLLGKVSTVIAVSKAGDTSAFQDKYKEIYEENHSSQESELGGWTKIFS